MNFTPPLHGGGKGALCPVLFKIKISVNVVENWRLKKKKIPVEKRAHIVKNVVIKQ